MSLAEKAEIIKNKVLYEKYPWLAEGKDEIDYEFTILDLLPIGWKTAFGDILLEEIDKVVKSEKLVNFRIVEMKEKWGGLDITAYFGTENNPGLYNEKLEELFSVFRKVSSQICSFCGKPRVPCTNKGWVLPVCRECFSEYYDGEYKECCNKEYIEVEDILQRICINKGEV